MLLVVEDVLKLLSEADRLPLFFSALLGHLVNVGQCRLPLLLQLFDDRVELLTLSRIDGRFPCPVLRLLVILLAALLLLVIVDIFQLRSLLVDFHPQGCDVVDKLHVLVHNIQVVLLVNLHLILQTLV